ncbi:thioesterase family protein [Aeromicrobium sp. CTD01-1L150]|uniref:thioesterase family protein n=1 Tax=Aeromicrobium sp. CTD01-1L150 TaxID=3341830 RepID=UPI0035C06996
MSELPTVDEVRELPAVRTTVVPQSYLDENDHMNIGRYFEEASTGLWEHAIELGLGEDYIDGRGLSTFTAEHHITYLNELRLGDQLSVHVRLLERSDKVLHEMAFVVDDTHDRLACLFESTLVHVDMSARRPTPFPDDIAAVLDAEITRCSRDWAAPVCGAMGVRRR